MAKPAADGKLTEKQALAALERELQKLVYLEEGERLRHFGPYLFQLKFMSAGAEFNQRLLMAANRVGKTLTGASEFSMHLTGEYPDWWKGKRFAMPVDAWCGSDSAETTRDIVQAALFGPPNDAQAHGTGAIPRRCIIGTTPRAGTPGAFGTATVKHKSGGTSSIGFKSYDQGRSKWQGTKKHVIWLDEEPPEDIYGEAVTRTLGCGGITFLTFTPLNGMSTVVKRFMQAGNRHGGEVTIATWDDAPHLDVRSKKELWATLPPHQRDARSRGIPSLGSGVIYPIDEEVVMLDDFKLAEHLPVMYALDVGWKRTAALWGALDRTSDIVYIYSEHYMGASEPPSHAAAIQARGKWIPGVIDPAAHGRAQKDGTTLIDEYRKLGLHLISADNAVESGIHEVWMRLVTGRLKVFKSCRNFLNEFRAYHRDTDGKIVKEDDHLMDCLRYLVRGVKTVARVSAPPPPSRMANMDYDPFGHNEAWGRGDGVKSASAAYDPLEVN